jgi:hypothetical protein
MMDRAALRKPGCVVTLDALAIDIDLTRISQAVEILRPGHQIVDLNS